MINNKLQEFKMGEHPGQGDSFTYNSQFRQRSYCFTNTHSPITLAKVSFRTKKNTTGEVTHITKLQKKRNQIGVTCVKPFV
jgi:hypothetical protein